MDVEIVFFILIFFNVQRTWLTLTHLVLQPSLGSGSQIRLFPNFSGKSKHGKVMWLLLSGEELFFFLQADIFLLVKVTNRKRFIGWHCLRCVLKKKMPWLIHKWEKKTTSVFLFPVLNFLARVGKINRVLKQNPGKLSQSFSHCLPHFFLVTVNSIPN